MSVTHGGRYKLFEWNLIDDKICIANTEGKEHYYNLSEINKILTSLRIRFENEWFPLANNVELMGRGEEREGLGMTVLNITPMDITHAVEPLPLTHTLIRVGLNLPGQFQKLLHPL